MRTIIFVDLLILLIEIRAVRDKQMASIVMIEPQSVLEEAVSTKAGPVTSHLHVAKTPCPDQHQMEMQHRPQRDAEEQPYSQ